MLLNMFSTVFSSIFLSNLIICRCFDSSNFIISYKVVFLVVLIEFIFFVEAKSELIRTGCIKLLFLFNSMFVAKESKKSKSYSNAINLILFEANGIQKLPKDAPTSNINEYSSSLKSTSLGIAGEAS